MFFFSSILFLCKHLLMTAWESFACRAGSASLWGVQIVCSKDFHLFFRPAGLVSMGAKVCALLLTFSPHLTNCDHDTICSIMYPLLFNLAQQISQFILWMLLVKSFSNRTTLRITIDWRISQQIKLEIDLSILIIITDENDVVTTWVTFCFCEIIVPFSQYKQSVKSVRHISESLCKHTGTITC